jgi:BASS family bile acid:Na+ symporter
MNPLALLTTLTAAVQRRLLWIMLLAYALAAGWPAPGLALRSATPLRLGGTPLPLQAGLLAAMVFGAGLTARTQTLPALLHRPRTLAVGIAANALLPSVLLALGAVAAGGWHNPREAQSLLVGLILVGAMPVAAGATVFAQGSEGNATLTLGLVLGSTLLSPLTIPLGLHLGGFLAAEPYAADLHAAAAHASSVFAVLAVVLPCALGLALGRLLRAYCPTLLATALPAVKAVNLGVVVLLSYTNACGALGQVVSRPDPDFLVLVALAAAAMCGGSFLTGWVLAGRLGLSRADAIALAYASGMNNSSAGAVVAVSLPQASAGGALMAGSPAVLVPILAYSLLQKVLASLLGAFVRHARFGDETSVVG